jgi:hypothetical protein
MRRGEANACVVLDKNEVVMETTSTNECVLVLANKAIKLWGQAQRQHLRCNLADEVHKADGAVIAVR